MQSICNVHMCLPVNLCKPVQSFVGKPLVVSGAAAMEPSAGPFWLRLCYRRARMLWALAVTPEVCSTKQPPGERWWEHVFVSLVTEIWCSWIWFGNGYGFHLLLEDEPLIKVGRCAHRLACRFMWLLFFLFLLHRCWCRFFNQIGHFAVLLCTEEARGFCVKQSNKNFMRSQ